MSELTRRGFVSALGMAAAGSVGAAEVRGSSAASTLPVAGEYDMVVAGGSCTGVCAAVTAARKGLKVALVEYNSFFGGTATAALVPVWHSLYSTDGKTKIIGGLTEEIENRLLVRGEAKRLNPDNPSVGCYFNVAAMQLTLDELVTEAKTIVPYFKTQVVGAVKDSPSHLTHVIIENKSGRQLLKAKYFVDATGDADLVDRAGFKTWRFPKSEMQAHTLCAILANEEAVRKVHKGFSFEEVMKPSAGAGLDHVFYWTAPVIGASGLTFLAATRVSDCDPSVASDLTAGLIDARRQLKKILDTANRLYPMPEDKRLSLVSIGSDLGIRESRHIEAEYKVTAKDVLYGRHFDDVIGKGSYRCDIHEGKGIVFRYLDGHQDQQLVSPDGKVDWVRSDWRKDNDPRPTWYEIPRRALVPKGAENLVAAGRMIDCEREAYGALRVMVNCNQMGEAAGNMFVV